MTNLVDGGVVETPSIAAGCGCSICAGLRDDGNLKGVGPNDATYRPTPPSFDGNGFNVPAVGELLNIQQNPDGSYFFSGVRNIDAVLIGSRFAITNVTFSFPTAGSNYGPNYDSGLNNFHIDLNDFQKQAARDAFASIMRYTNLTLTEITETDTVHANIRISQTGDNDVGSAQGLFPSDYLPEAGDSWFGRTSQPYYDFQIKGTWGYSTMFHEIGHTMGLKHGGGDGLGGDYTNSDLSDFFGTSPRFGTRSLTPENDGQAWSLMTYTLTPGVATFGGEKINQPQTYMQYDIAALQYMYGANFNTNATNTVYTWSETTGEMFINGVGQGAPSGNKILMTLWDGDGVDTFDLQNYDAGVLVDLRPGGFSTFDVNQLANHTERLNTVNLAPGNVANTLLFNNDARSLIENVIGGDGNDIMVGNAANNVLTGGAGNDSLAGGLGSDTLIGGLGIDTASFADAAAGVVVTLDAAGDAIVTVGGDTDTLTGMENVIGTAGADTLTGNGANNTLDGGTGGFDTLVGGAGDDRLLGGGFTISTVYDAAFTQPDVIKPAIVENETIATAISVDGFFDAQPDPNIANATTVPHATVQATANGGGLEYYAITVGVAGATATFDIDTGNPPTGTLTDSFLELVNQAGVVLASNDTGAADPGSVPFPVRDDSTLTFTFAQAGVYYIRVGQYSGLTPTIATPLTAGQTYTLHISLTSAPVPVITTINNTSSASLSGGDGADFLQGTLGDDTIDGGAGTNDTVSYVNAFVSGSTGVTVNLGTAGAQNTVAAGTDTLTGVENIVGSGRNDTLTGTAANNVIEGGQGDDVLNALGGIDTASYAGAVNGVTVSLALQGAAQQTAGAGSDTLTGFENLTGSAFADTLSGDAIANVLTGGDGDDVLIANGLGAVAGTPLAPIVDTLIGGNGSDTASFAPYSGNVVATLNGAFTVVAAVNGVSQATLAGIENLTGGSGNDQLAGDAGANTLVGNGGNDDLSGGGGDDILEGGLGVDLLFGGSGSDTVRFGGADAVTVDLRLTGAQLAKAGSTVTLSGIENISGSSGNDDLTGDDGNNTFFDTGGADIYQGNGGSDTVVYGGAASAGVTVNLGLVVAQGASTGGDTLTGIENVVGTNFNDTLTGNNDANRLEGGVGLDILVGQAGDDTVVGGDGNDGLVGDSNGGISALDGADVLEGGLGTDVLIGGGGNDIMRGGKGDDTLVGGFGAVGTTALLTQVFTNDAGFDVYDGGDGDDLAYAYYTDQTGGVAFDLANIGGNSAITVGGAAAGSFISIDRLIFRGGLGGDTVTGTGTLDNMRGNAGNDVLNGFLGDDRLYGGLGDDTINGGVGLDYADYTESATGVNVNLLTGVATGEGSDTLVDIEYLQGSAFSDVLRGTNDFNYITDTGGVLNGLLNQQGGSDSIYGEGGNDEINVTRNATATAGNILLDGGTGDDIIQLNSGTVSPAPAANPIGLSGTTITALNATGNRFLDTVTVDAGDGNDRVVLTAVDAATVNLGAGNDVLGISLLGAAGVSDHAITTGAGQDIVQINGSNIAVSTTARANVITDFTVGNGGDRFELTGILTTTNFIGGFVAGSNPFASGYARLLQDGADFLLQLDRDGAAGAFGFVTIFRLQNTYTGGFTAFNFDGFDPAINVVGFATNETITGGTQADNLNGGDGDDVLKGLGGNDTLDGGAGNDTADYSEKTTAVVVTLNGATPATVTVNGVAEDTVVNIENVIGGSGDDLLTGDVLANRLVGGAGNDQLDGADGADNLNGNLGNDLVAGGAGDDFVVGGQGDDTVAGGADNDFVAGGQGNDLVNGGAGDDVMEGNDGFDTAFYGDAASGVTVSLALQGAAQATGGAGSDTLSGFEAVTGSAFADTLTGSAADDVISGQAGADTLSGGDGADRIEGGSGMDSLFGNIGNDFLNGGLDEDVVVGGQGDDTVFGGQGDDQLFGGLGADILGGGVGADLMDGNGGADTFAYFAASHSVIGSRDLISNFVSGEDKIDLTAVTTNPGDTFTITTAGNLTLLNVDLLGDGTIDMQIAFANNSTVLATDILF